MAEGQVSVEVEVAVAGGGVVVGTEGSDVGSVTATRWGNTIATTRARAAAAG